MFEEQSKSCELEVSIRRDILQTVSDMTETHFPTFSGIKDGASVSLCLFQLQTSNDVIISLSTLNRLSSHFN